MYSRLFNPPDDSYFLFGPRGVGKSSLMGKLHPQALYFDLLEAEIFNPLVANPQRLDLLIPQGHRDWVIIDEVQKIPALLDEVHRLIERRKIRFVLTGSSARKLKAKGVNLLAGRALSCRLYPLTSQELGRDFDLSRSLQYGHLPKASLSKTPRRFLSSYVQTYLKEEIQQEGLTRNIQGFARFLEAASFSQANVLSMAAVARDCSLHRKVVEEYFTILQDLLMSYELPVFTKRAKRKLVAHPKFYFFDVGVYRAMRPQGPLDSDADIEGPALETLVLQELTALNAYHYWDYQISYWRTQGKQEVDFVLYGKKGFHAIEVKRSSRLRDGDLDSLMTFVEDYPQAKAILLYTGTRKMNVRNISIIPIENFFAEAANILS